MGSKSSKETGKSKKGPRRKGGKAASAKNETCKKNTSADSTTVSLLKEKRLTITSAATEPPGAIEFLRDPVLILDAETLQILACNSAVCEMYLYSRDELLNLDILALSSVAERDLAKNKIHRRARGKKEFQHLRKDGMPLVVEFDNVEMQYASRRAYFCLLHDISTRSQLIRALLDSDARNREIIENASDIIYTHNLRGDFTTGNKASTRLLGYSREEFLHMNIRDLILREDIGKALEAISAKTVDRPVVPPYNIRVVAKDGTTRTLEVNSRLIFKDGEPIGIQGVARDISERIRVEAALRESEAKFRAVAESAPCAILIYQGSRLRYVNPGAEEITGYSEKELLDIKEFWMLAAPEFQEIIRERAMARQRGEFALAYYEFQIRRKDGEDRWMDFVATNINYQSQPAVLVMVFDVSDRKRHEAELKKSEERFRQLFERNMAGVFRCRFGGQFLECNDSFAHILGCKNSAEVLQHSAWDFSFSADSREGFIKLLKEQRVLTNVEERLRRLDGREIWFLENVAIVNDTDGEEVIEGTIIEITERKLAEAEIKASEERYRHLFEKNLAGVFVSTMDGKIIDCNESFAQIYGYSSRAEVFTHHANDLYLSAEDRAKFVNRLRQE